MKNSFLFILLSFLGFSGLQAQADVDTNYYDPPEKMDRFIFDFGHATWLNAPKGVETEPWSYDIALHYMQDIPFGESGFATAIGFGFSSHNVFHNAYFLEDSDGGATEMIPYSSGQEPDKNKLSATYFDVPLELRFRTSSSPAFKIAIGGRAGYLANLHQKIIDEDGKRKLFDLEGVSPFRYGAYARIGVGRWNLFAYYALPPFFQEGKGPSLQQVSGGLSITLF